MSRMLPVLICALLLFSGCAFNLGGGAETKSYFVFNDKGFDKQVKYKHKDSTILVRDATSSQFLNSLRIVFSDSPMQRKNYQYSFWVEPPAKRFSVLLIRRLESCGLFTNVSRRSSSAAGDIQINTEILEFYHDTSFEPGEVKVVVHVELLDLNKFSIIAEKNFERVVKVKSFDVEGAVDAFGSAVSKILDELLDWLKLSLEESAYNKPM